MSNTSNTTTNEINDKRREDHTNPYFRWGQMKTEKLPDDFDINRLRLARPIVVDEPLFSSSITVKPTTTTTQDHIELKPLNNLNRKNKNEINKLKEEENSKQVQINLQPTIDSYIVNTIKLNRILHNNLTFEQVEYFMCKSAQRSKRVSAPKRIDSDEQARHALKQFIVIMSLHSGFTQASSLALDILVEVLDDYISAFFKLLRSLQQIHQADPNKNDPKTSLVQYNHYSSQVFIKQAFEELGVGSVEDIRTFYQNDVIDYHQETFRKVTKLYDDYKARKLAEKLQLEMKSNAGLLGAKLADFKSEGESRVEEFIRENDL